MTQKETSNKVTGSQSPNVTENKAEESCGVCSVTDVKGLLQIVEIEVHRATTVHKVLTSCDFACSHSWVSEIIAPKLERKGSPTKRTVVLSSC